MTKYLKKFDAHSEYVEFTETSDFIKPNVSYCEDENEVHYNPFSWADEYFTIESLEDNNTIYLKALNSAVTKTVSASTDNGSTWTEYTSSTGSIGTTLATINKGDKLLIKGENSAYATASQYNQFRTSGRFEVKGNIMSLVSGDSFANADELTANYTFFCIFSNCTMLTSVENLVLPATALVEGCYQSMFQGCRSLTSAPDLPAKALAYDCYSLMFRDCASLTVAPELPATTLAQDCYSFMFSNCTSLTTAPELPATTLASNCYYYMFDGCTNLTTAPELPATTLASYCYANMFQGCTSLTTAPELPATTLANYCYYQMFYGCTNLTTITSIGANNGDVNGTNNIFGGCYKLNYVVFASNSINDNMFLNLGTFGTDSVNGTLVLNSISLYNDNYFLIQFCNKNWRIILNGNDMGINNVCSGGGSSSWGSGSWGSGS